VLPVRREEPLDLKMFPESILNNNARRPLFNTHASRLDINLLGPQCRRKIPLCKPEFDSGNALFQ